jgi:hypothetical protein
VLFSQFKIFTKSQSVVVANIRKDTEKEHQKPQESTQNLFYAFFYETFLQDHGIDDSGVDELMMLVVEVA